MHRIILLFFLIIPGILYSQTNTLFDEVTKLYDEGKFKECLALEKSLIEWVGSRNDTIAADVYSYLGFAYMETGSPEKAIPYFEKEEAILSVLLPIRTEGYSNALYNLATVYRRANKIEQAKAVAQKLIAHSLFYYVRILSAMGEFADAEMELERVRKVAPDFSAENGLLLSVLAELCTYSGKYNKAERLFFDALQLLKISEGVEGENYLVALSNYGTLLIKQGKYDQAKQLFEEVLATSPDQATLNNLAIVERRLGQYKESENSFKKLMAADSITIGTNHPDYAITLLNVALLYLDENKLLTAERALQKSLDILKSNGESKSVTYAICLNNLSRVYQQSGRLNEAISTLQQALKVYEKTVGKQSPEYATATFNLGTAYLYQKSPKALAKLKEALIIREKTLGKSHPLYGECEERLAQYYWMKKNKAETGKLYKNVFDNYYGQIDSYFPVLTEEEKSNFFFQKVKPSIETYATFSVEQHHDAKALAQLYDYHVNTKGLILFATEKVRKSVLSSGDSSLMALYEKWEDAKDVLTYYYSVHESQTHIDSLIRESNNLEKELVRKSSSFAKNMDRTRISWQSIQSKLKPGEAALECLRYRIFNPDSIQFSNRVGYAFLLLTSETKEGPVLIHVTNGNDLETRFLKYYRNSIRLKLDDMYTFKNFWEPVHDQLTKLNIKKVFFSPDGVYNTINISSLKNIFTNQYIIDEVDVRMVTSTRTLLEEAKVLKTKSVGYLIGFPKYKVAADQSQAQTGGALSASGTRSFRGGMLRFMRGGQGIPPLPGTKVEIDQISEDLKNHFASVEVKLESQALESDIKNLVNPSLIHIATHGYFLDEEDGGGALIKMPNPLMMSGLILAGAENFIQTGHNPLQEHDDGILTAYEAMNLSLDETSLVVLSACETGLGKVQAGEGVYGLQRAFQVAGASAIIMSLWSVDDTATQMLMGLFYEEYLRTNDLYSSFRNAQQELKKKYPQPFYWGAFILVGRGE